MEANSYWEIWQLEKYGNILEAEVYYELNEVNTHFHDHDVELAEHVITQNAY